MRRGISFLCPAPKGAWFARLRARGTWPEGPMGAISNDPILRGRDFSALPSRRNAPGVAVAPNFHVNPLIFAKNLRDCGPLPPPRFPAENADASPVSAGVHEYNE